MNMIRPVSDLRNNFAEISKIVHEKKQPVFCWKAKFTINLKRRNRKRKSTRHAIRPKMC